MKPEGVPDFVAESNAPEGMLEAVARAPFRRRLISVPRGAWEDKAGPAGLPSSSSRRRQIRLSFPVHRGFTTWSFSPFRNASRVA